MNNTIRILQVTYSLKAAGIESFVTNCYKSIDRRKIQFDFVSYYDSKVEEFFEQDVKALGARVYKLGYEKRGSILLNLKIRKRFYECVKNNHYEIVHIHASSGLSLLEAFAAKRAGVEKIIIHSHSSNISKKNRFGEILKIITKLTRPIWRYVGTEYCACSDSAAEWLFSKGLLSKVKIIPNGIDTSRFIFNEKKRKELREDYSIAENEILICQVASFTDAKNHEYSLEIIENFNNINQKVRLVCLGDGPCMGKIREGVEKKKLSGQVLFLGIRKDVVEWMSASDVLILPSKYEGLPMVCVEAQYIGIPIIVSDVITRQVKISDNIFFESIESDSQNWVKRILMVVKEHKQTAVINNEFDIKETVRRLEMIYQ